MKLGRIITVGVVAVAAFAPVAAFADEITSSSTTINESIPSTSSTTVVEKEPVIVAPTENRTTVVDKRKRKHLLSLPFVHVF